MKLVLASNNAKKLAELRALFDGLPIELVGQNTLDIGEADAVDLHHRLPQLNAGITAGTVRVANARHVAQATRELGKDEAAWVDAEVAEVADGRLGWKRFEALVEGKVAAASPELARAKEEAAASKRGIHRTRIDKHGMATLLVHSHAAVVVGIQAGIEAYAEALKDTMPGASLNDRRLAALALLTNPDARPDVKAGPVKPNVKIYLHLTPDSPIARMEGHGPVTTSYVRHLINRVIDEPGKVRITPVIGFILRLGPISGFVESRLQNVYTKEKGFVDTKSIQQFPVVFGLVF